MVVSIDGRTTGKYLDMEGSKQPIELYFKMDKEFNYNAFACGRTTFEDFTEGNKLDLEKFKGQKVAREDKVYTKDAALYAVAFDGKGKLAWPSDTMPKNPYGYEGAKILEVLTEQASDEYIAYLQSIKCNYIIAGKDTIDLKLALEKLYNLFNIKKLLLEGGSVINGYFLREDLIDEINLIVAPLTAEKDSKPLFADGTLKEFKLTKTTNENGVAVLRFARDKK